MEGNVKSERDGKKWLQSIVCSIVSWSCIFAGLLVIDIFPVSAAGPYETWVFKGYAVGKENGTEIAGVSMAEVIRLDDGTYRMYYGTVLGGGLNGIKYADSTDCVTWTVKGTALKGTSGETDPEYVINGASILKLPDGRYRMYYQAAPYAENEVPKLHVRSAISSDKGKTFTKEEGVRINISHYDGSSTLSLAGHGTYFYAADGTTVVGIFCANFASNPIAPSDLVMATSTDDGLTFGNYASIYKLWHDPIVLKVDGAYRLYATNLVGDPAPYQGIAISSDGVTWPSSMTEVSLVDADNNPLTEKDSGVGDIGGVVMSSGSIRLFTNYEANRSSNIVYFDKKPVLKVARSGSGTVTSTPSGIDCGPTCSATYDEGTTVTLTATAATGSRFTGWSGDCGGTGACTITMTADVTMSAVFDPIVYTINASVSGGHGTVSPATQEVSYGGSASIAMTADTGYYIGSLTDNGQPVTSVSADQRKGSTMKNSRIAGSALKRNISRRAGATAITNPYVISNVTANHDVVVTFEVNTYTLAAAKTGTGSGTLSATGLTCSGNSCSGTYSYGTSVIISATPDAGSMFTSWTGCDSASGSTCTVAMTSNKSVTARFTTANPCTYTISPGSKSFPYRGGKTNVTVKAEGATSCANPDITVSETWIGAKLGSFKKNKGSVNIIASANTMVTARTGTVTIMGNTFNVTEAGTPCSLTGISPAKATYTSGGGSGSFSVTATTGCKWSAEVASAATSWLGVSGATGSGSGSVSYVVSKNTTKKQRNGKITVYLTQTPTKKKMFTVVERK
jgi:hypothetical protein